MTGIVGLWSHALAALLYAALAVWALRRRGETAPLAPAFAVTALWAAMLALDGAGGFFAGVSESARNFAFLSFMFAIVRGAADSERQRALKAVYVTVAAVIGLQLTIAGVVPRFEGVAVIGPALASTFHLLGLTIAAGSLVLVHNLYGQAAPDSRWGLRLPALALAAMWTYDLHLYTMSYLGGALAEDLFAMRGAAMAMLVPLFALASRRSDEWKLRLSRAATFQSISLIGILVYLIAMMASAQALAIAGGEWARIAQIALITTVTLTAAVLLGSSRARAWARVTLTKHLFEHRYDYRAEWLGFTRTIGRAGEDGGPLGERVVKALADIAAAPAGQLLLVEEGGLAPFVGWNWTHEAKAGSSGDIDLIRFFEATGHIIEFDRLERGGVAAGGRRAPVPGWMTAAGHAWAGVPLLHNDRLVGVVILAHPLVRRRLDWEDFDLFRAAGIQAASYLAEALSQEALAEARRFDEFNRRFAFIMHDIKNLVSQLSLVARNAERHADNPEFRADMMATLQGSVRKMNGLLALLSHGRSADAEPPRPTAVAELIAQIAAAKARAHPIETASDDGLAAKADPARLEQAIQHLVQNAIDSSEGGEPVRISAARHGSDVAIEITDRGAGMSAEFVRSRLFQPFASTKDGGFGIGAFEARSLIAAMGGRLEVESREGAGSRFTIFLPAAQIEAIEPIRRRA